MLASELLGKHNYLDEWFDIFIFIFHFFNIIT